MHSKMSMNIIILGIRISEDSDTEIRISDFLLYMLWFDPRPRQHKIRAAAQATNAAARTEPWYSRSRSKRRRLQLGPNYATLVSHRRHLACGRQARIFPIFTSMWPLKKPWKVPKIGPAMARAIGPAPPALYSQHFLERGLENLNISKGIKISGDNRYYLLFRTWMLRSSCHDSLWFS